MQNQVVVKLSKKLSKSLETQRITCPNLRSNKQVNTYTLLKIFQLNFTLWNIQHRSSRRRKRQHVASGHRKTGSLPNKLFVQYFPQKVPEDFAFRPVSSLNTIAFSFSQYCLSALSKLKMLSIVNILGLPAIMIINVVCLFDLGTKSP